MKTIEVKEVRRSARIADTTVEVDTATLVKSPHSGDIPGDTAQEVEPADVPVSPHLLYALISLLLVIGAPAISIFFSAAAIVGALRRFQGFRATLALALGTITALTAILFWVLWATFRPTPRVLIAGWIGLRHLPAASFGLAGSRYDPFNFIIDPSTSPFKHRPHRQSGNQQIRQQ